MSGRVLQLARRIDAREPPHQIIPEEHLQVRRAVRSQIHECDPGENHRRLQEQAQVQFPA